MGAAPTRISFRVGDVFPADDAVAVFLVALSSALADSVRTSKWLLGANHRGPGRRHVAPDEGLHLLRLQLAQLHEVRETVRHGRKEPKVQEFLVGLGDAADQDLATVLGYGAPGVGWVKNSIEHLRHQTFHYGGKWNWDHMKWALAEAEEVESGLVSFRSNLAGLSLGFADEIATQHLLRHVPERASDPHAELSNDVAVARLSELMKAASAGVTAAQNLLLAALVAHLDALPEGMASWSGVGRRERMVAALRRWNETRSRLRRR